MVAFVSHLHGIATACEGVGLLLMGSRARDAFVFSPDGRQLAAEAAPRGRSL